MRKYTIPSSMAVEYLVSTGSIQRLGDHLGSTTITTDANGAKVSEMRYKPCPLRCASGMLREGEIRYSWTSNPSTTPAYKLPQYTFTGQFSDSYINLLWYGSRHYDPTTAGVTEGFGLMFYNARMYDPALGRFTSADMIVPIHSQGVQAWDRFAYTNNNPVRYNDPSGHCIRCWVIGTGLVIAGSFILSAVGVTPDYMGIATTMALTDTNDAVVAAGLAVQSQYPWAIFMGGGTGLAQAGSDEIEEGQNPYSPSVAVEVMEERIQNALKECKRCTTGYDRLIVAALAQNGSIQGLDNFGNLPLNPETNTIDWEFFFSNPEIGNSSDPFAQLRADIRNEQYSTLFMLRLYTQDLRVFMTLGYQLPDGISEDDVKYIEDNFLNHNQDNRR